MPIYLLTILVQILFALHAHRSGRNTYWIYLILFVPGLGLIYFMAEVLPELVHGRTGKLARKKLKSAMDPEKDFRDTKYAFDTAPTVQNRVHLAQLLVARKQYDAAIELLVPALTQHFADDVVLLEGLAYAYYGMGDFKNALAYIQKIYDSKGAKPQNDIQLLRARAHIGLYDLTIAEEQLTELVLYFSGEEARIALAQLLVRMGREGEARAVYQDIVTRSSHAPGYYQRQERHWVDMAKQALKQV